MERRLSVLLRCSLTGARPQIHPMSSDGKNDNCLPFPKSGVIILFFIKERAMQPSPRARQRREDEAAALGPCHEPAPLSFAAPNFLSSGRRRREERRRALRIFFPGGFRRKPLKTLDSGADVTHCCASFSPSLPMFSCFKGKKGKERRTFRACRRVRRLARQQGPPGHNEMARAFAPRRVGPLG